MAQREQLAFMFVDMMGWTRAAEELPDEAVLELLETFEAVVRTQVAQFAGRLIKFLGDAAFVAFDSAADAVRCAVHIQRARAQARAAGSSPLPLCIGISYGSALRWRDDYTGVAVNQAAHLENGARGWEILISEEARLAAGELPEIGYEPLPVTPPRLSSAFRVLAEGLPLPEGAPPRREPRLPTNRDELLELFFTLEERLRAHQREQTFLSVDVVVSTGLKTEEDPLAVEYSFRNYHRFVTQVIREHGGRVDSAAGDGVLAVFERSEDAARAAAALQSQLPDFNRTRNRLRRPFALRCGINTGEVVLPDLRDTTYLFSRVIDTAAHLQKACLSGEVWVSDTSVEGARRVLGSLRRLSAPIDGITVYAWPDTTGASDVPEE